MSVLIKTMTNLPDHCYDCPCRDGESGYCQADKEHRYSDYRPFWCPLVEISIVAEGMTKEKAIEILQRLWLLECEHIDSFEDEEYKAFKIAIEALKRENTLEKIRAEIEDTGAYEQEVHGKTEFVEGINYCLGVFDKYKISNEE